MTELQLPGGSFWTCPLTGRYTDQSNHGNLGDLADGVSSQSSAGDVLQFTSADGRDEVQVVGLVQLVPQILQTQSVRSSSIWTTRATKRL